MEYSQAKKQVEDIKGFYIHLTMYLIVIGFLYGVDFLTGGGWWFYWPALIWGSAVLMHGVAFLFDLGIFGKDWEEKKIKELMHKSN